MAGAGYKLFNTGDVLTAAQVNTYLMEQTVMVFANAAARTTALSGVVSEGMISYLKDTNAVEVYDGSNWVSSDDPNAIQNTIVDAKGDLITATAADTPARLAVGSNGDTLVADSAATTGLRWQSAYNGNAIINGGMDFWQRGTSFTSASVYTADRWFKGSQSGFTVSRQTASLDGFQYSLRLQRDSGTSNTVGTGMYHNIETQESLRFANKTVVVSFWAKCGANYSPTSSLLGYILYTGTGTDQARTQSVGFTGEAQPASGTVTLTTSWQRFSFTATIASTATEICFNPYMVNTGTAGANDWFEITGVQLELGSVPTTFKRAGGTLQGELAACRRYLPALSGVGNNLPAAAKGTADSVVFWNFDVVPRKEPTGLTVSNVSHFTLYNKSSSTGTPTAITFNTGGMNGVTFVATTTAGSPTIAAGETGQFYFNSSSALILFTGCEL